MPETAGDTGITRPVVTDLKSVNSLPHFSPVFPSCGPAAPLSIQTSSWFDGGWHPWHWDMQTDIWSRSTRENKLSGKPLQAESWTWMEQLSGGRNCLIMATPGNESHGKVKPLWERQWNFFLIYYCWTVLFLRQNDLCCSTDCTQAEGNLGSHENFLNKHCNYWGE